MIGPSANDAAVADSKAPGYVEENFQPELAAEIRREESPEATVAERRGAPADTRTERKLGARSGRAPAPRKRPHDPLRDRLEALYSQRFPEARKVVANTAYENGPLVEVHRKGGIDLYRPTLDEQGGGA